jgi:hypothetical protein
MGLHEGESRVRLVGRAVELEVLRAVIEDAATGRARFVLLEGEAGIGKSRLIADALALAQGRGFRILSGGCDEIERDRPLLALSEALEVERGAPDPPRAKLARLLEADEGPPGRVVHGAGIADQGWLIVEAVLDVLEEFASAVPIALAVEDLQWADPLTLRALHSITRHLTRLPLVLLATVRGGSHGPDVDRAIADLLARGAEHVLLGPLSSHEAAHLAGEVVGHPAGPRLLEQVGGAGGNPLFVVELVRALAYAMTLPGTDRWWALLEGRCTIIVAFDASGDLKPAKPEAMPSCNAFEQLRDIAWKQLGIMIDVLDPGYGPTSNPWLGPLGQPGPQLSRPPHWWQRSWPQLRRRSDTSVPTANRVWPASGSSIRRCPASRDPQATACWSWPKLLSATPRPSTSWTTPPAWTGGGSPLTRHSTSSCRPSDSVSTSSWAGPTPALRSKRPSVTRPE